MKKIILALSLVVCFLPFNLYALEIMLPQVYSEGMDVKGWLMSEKLDGVRGYWDGKQLLSKNGNLFFPPPEFTRNFPPFPLEGELWGGRETFAQTVSIVKKQQPHDGWLQIQFAIFDVPAAGGGCIQRLQQASDWFTQHPTRFAFVIEQKMITDNQQLQHELQRVEKLGGEGLIVRNPDSLYTIGRSDAIVKVKSYFDQEAVVVGHRKGKGRNMGRLGSLVVELLENRAVRFKIGGGFSDHERENPPPVGAVISFKYYGLYPSGIPKFPSFLRVREDTSL